MDGTLADTERDGHRVAFNRAFAAAGLDWHWDVNTYGRLLQVTGGKERIRYFIEAFKPSIDAQLNLDDFIPALHQSKTGHFVTLLQSGAIHLRVGVKRLLLEARGSGLRLAIVTTTTAPNVTALLGATLGEESIGWFDVIAAGDVVPAKKPAPDIYLYALRELGLQATECMAFEDSDNGLLSAAGAGLKTLVTVNGYTRQQDFSAAALVLDHLGEPAQAFTVLAAPGSFEVGDAHCVDVALIQRLFVA